MNLDARLALPVPSPAAVDLRTAVTFWARDLWHGLQALGARRARAELLRVARLRESSDPELAAQLRKLVGEDWLTHN